MKKFTLVAWAALAAFGFATFAEMGEAYAQAEVKRVRCKITPREDAFGNPVNGLEIKVTVQNVEDIVAGFDDYTPGGVDVWVSSDPIRPPVRLSEKHLDQFPILGNVQVEWNALYDPLNPDPLQVDPVLDIAEDFAFVDELVTVYAEGWWLDPNDIDSVPVRTLSTKAGSCVEKGSQIFKQDTKCLKNSDRPNCPGYVGIIEAADYDARDNSWDIQGLANDGNNISVDLYNAAGFRGTIGSTIVPSDGKWSLTTFGGILFPADGDTVTFVNNSLGESVGGFPVSIK